MIQNDLEELKQLYYDFKKVQDDCGLRLIDKKIYNYKNLYFLYADFRPLLRSIAGDSKYTVFMYSNNLFRKSIFLIEEKDDSKNYYDMLVFNPFKYGMIANKSKITFLNGLIDKVLTYGRELNDEEKLYLESLEWVKIDMKFIIKHTMN